MKHFFRGASAIRILLWFAIAFSASMAGSYVARRVAASHGANAAQSPAPAEEHPQPAAPITVAPPPRLLYAQIVDDEPKDAVAERAILEGKPFKNLLKLAAAKTCAQLREATDEKLLFEYLSDEPDLHRGAPYTPGRGVVLEVARVELDPAYGFAPGWTVLPAVYINTAKELYALRFICPPGSTLYDRLKKGVTTDELPVINLAGLFFKNYARKTSDPKEKPWVRPLLVCPEPEFPANVEPRHVLKELEEAGYGNLLPSLRIDAPGAEERLVLETSFTKGGLLLSDAATAKTPGAEVLLNDAIASLKQRLPVDQAAHPSVVVLLRGGAAADPRVQKLLAEIKAAGVERVSIKLDSAK